MALPRRIRDQFAEFLEEKADNVAAGLKSVGVGELSPTESEGVSQSTRAALSSGFAVAESFGSGSKVVDFASYDTDDAALQSLVDWLEQNTNGGTIYCPSADSTGSQISIDNTVSMDPSKRIPISWYFTGGFFQQGPLLDNAITTTINDGSPMFDLCGDVGNRLVGTMDFVGNAWQLGDNEATLLRTRDIGGMTISPGQVKGSSGDLINLDSRTFDSWIDYGTFIPNSTDANIIVTSDSLGGSPGADVSIGPHVKTEDSFACAVKNSGNHQRLRIQGGKFEGASGTGMIEQTTNNVMYISPSTILGRTNGSTHAVYQSAGVVVCCPSGIVNTAGDGVRITPGATGTYIWPNIRVDGVSGDTIHFEGDTGGMVPYENTIGGSVTYPSAEPWTQLYYPDGWQKLRSFTGQSVSAGGTAVPNSFMGRLDTQVKAEVWLDSDPGGAAEWGWHWGWDTGNTQMNLVLEEKSGTSSVSLSGVVYRRGQNINLA